MGAGRPTGQAPRSGQMPSVGAIVAAAGTGSRLGRGGKALGRLNGRTTLARGLELLLALDEIDRVVVVGPPGPLQTAGQEGPTPQPPQPGRREPGGGGPPAAG